MRRLLRIALLGSAAVLLFSAPAHAGNPQHAGLQAALRAWGLYSGPIDGILGPQTRDALKRFQKRKGLPVNGVAGTKTRLALGPLGRPLFGRRTMKRGVFGWDVSVLQFLLIRAGIYDGAIDGYLGPETQAALQRWQRSVQIAADGVAGPRTLSALGTRTSTPVAGRQEKPKRTAFYVVRRGDTLTAIAVRFRTTIGTIARLNHFDPDALLAEGRRLRIPKRRPPALRPTRSVVRLRLDHWAGTYGVDPKLVRALAWMESGYQPDIVSSAGARGIMQLLPVTRDYVETVLLARRLPRTVDGDIHAGVVLLHHLLGRFDGSERLALAAWYQGERGVRERGVIPETKVFVDNVLALKPQV